MSKKKSKKKRIQPPPDYYRRGSPSYFERAERRAGRQYRAAYLPLIGDAPECHPGDHARAQAFLTRIELAVAHGGWTRVEWARLRRLRKKWSARALGHDPHFETFGNMRMKTAGAEHKKMIEQKKSRQIMDRVKNLAMMAEFEALDADQGKGE